MPLDPSIMHLRLSSQRRDIGQTVLTDREHKREIGEDLPGMMARVLYPPRRERFIELCSEALRPENLGQQRHVGVAAHGHCCGISSGTGKFPGSIPPGGAR